MPWNASRTDSLVMNNTFFSGAVHVCINYVKRKIPFVMVHIHFWLASPWFEHALIYQLILPHSFIPWKQPSSLTRFHPIVTERENHLRAVGEPGGKDKRHRRVHNHHPTAAEALRGQLPGHLDWPVRDIVCGVLLCVFPANMERTYHPLAAAAHLPDDVRFK